MDILKPAKLNKGDVIGIVAPASPVLDPSRIERGATYLENLGYRVIVGENVLKGHGYLAGTDEERASDLHSMFRNRRVKAIICARGGYGTPRLLRLLDYKLIRRNPKILAGFSDITALQLALWTRCKLVTFHAPMLATDMADIMDPFTEEMFWRLITSDRKIGPVTIPDPTQVKVLRPGTFTGRVLGGNLSIIVSLFGTPYQPSFDHSVLFLEEVGEEPYRVDRMLTQLTNGSLLTGCRGMMIGQCMDCVPRDSSRPSLSLDQVLEEFARAFRKPVISGLPFGHVTRKMTLPVGARVRVTTESTSVEVLEGAVA